METKVLHLYSSVRVLGPQGPESRQETAETTELYEKQDLTQFQDLRDLELENIFDDLASWKSQLIQILKWSPGLQTLGLGLASETIVRVGDQEQGDLYFNFFERLFEAYAGDGGPPLSLATLPCGTALFPMEAESLVKLTNLSCLEEVYIEDQGVYDDKDSFLLYKDVSGKSGIAFGAFDPGKCRRFSTVQYKRNIHEYLCAIPKFFAHQLPVSFETLDEDYEIGKLLREDQEYESLPLQLRMMDLGPEIF
jgi:hypothetical protein